MADRQEHEAIELARKLRYDLTAMQGKVTELLRMLVDAGLEPRERFRCHDCGGLSFPSLQKLAEHVYHHHDPEAVPPHWLAAEQRAEEPVA